MTNHKRRISDTNQMSVLVQAIRSKTNLYEASTVAAEWLVRVQFTAFINGLIFGIAFGGIVVYACIKLL